MRYLVAMITALAVSCSQSSPQRNSGEPAGVAPNTTDTGLYVTSAATGTCVRRSVAKVSASDLPWGTPLAFGSQPTYGAQRVAVFLFTFADNSNENLTPGEVADDFFNDADSISEHIRAFSNGTSWLVGDVYGYYALPITLAECVNEDAEGYIMAAAIENAIDITHYDRLVAVFNVAANCDNAATTSEYPGLVVLESPAALNGRTLAVHELGHTLGLAHTRRLDSCDLDSYAPSSSRCTDIEYGHRVDALGAYASYGRYAPPALVSVGWLGTRDTEPVRTVTASGSFALQAMSATAQGNKGITIPVAWDASTGMHTFYTLELRQPLNFESALASHPTITDGVLINLHTVGVDIAQTTWLVDATPATSGNGQWDQDVDVGSSFVDAEHGIVVTPTALSEVDGSPTASVDITLPTPGGSCLKTSPTVSATALWGKRGPGESDVYDVIITNNDGATCPATTFSVQVSGLPVGFTTRTVPDELVLLPSARLAAQLHVTSSAMATSGTTLFDVTVADVDDAQHAASISAAFEQTDCVHASPGMSVTGPARAIGRGETAALDVAITNAHSGDCADVATSLTLRSPIGWNAATSALVLDSGAAFEQSIDVAVPLDASAGAYLVALELQLIEPNARAETYWALAGATLDVVDCVSSAPRLSVDAGATTMSPGGVATQVVTITSDDSAGCASRDMSLELTLPEGIDGVLASNQVTLAPHASATSDLTLSAAADAVAGDYRVTIALRENGATVATAEVALIVSQTPALPTDTSDTATGDDAASARGGGGCSSAGRSAWTLLSVALVAAWRGRARVKPIKTSG